MKFCLLVFILFPVSLKAMEFSYSGKAFSDTYFSTQNLSSKTFEQQTLSLWLQGDLKLFERYSLRMVYQGDGFEANNSALTGGYSSSFWRSTWREIYGEYNSDSLQVREGKQIISWGKSDGVNPTDYFSARDYSYLNPDDEVRRISGTAVMTNWTPDGGTSPWTFTLVTQFVAPKGKALIPPSQIPAGITLRESQPIVHALTNNEYAVKASYAGSGWDFSLSFYNGFNHQPEYVAVSLAELMPVYRRVVAYGADASKSFSKWVLRFEGAYYRTENDDGTNPMSQPTHLDAVAGVEHPIGNDFRISGQVLIRYFPRYTAIDQVSGPDMAIASTNALLQQYQDRTKPSSSLRVAYTPEGSDFSGECFFIYSFAGGDYLLRPQANYKPIDNLKLTLGADQYGGDTTKPLGSLRPYNSIFFEAKYSF